MSKNRIIYQNWIVDIGFDPSQMSSKIMEEGIIDILSLDEIIESENDLSGLTNHQNVNERTEKLRAAVQNALDNLTEDEREFIIRFYFMGESYFDISEKSKRAVYKLASTHKRIIKKLKISLASFVGEQFGIEFELDNNCPICNSSYVDEINSLIKNRDKKRTWKPVLKVIKEKYNLSVRTPQTLIGHEKYHMSK